MSCNGCSYSKLCRRISHNNNICIRIIHQAIEDYTWKKRAIYRYEAQEQYWDKMDLSLQIVNPFKEFNSCDIKRDSIVLPLMSWQKPLFYDLKLKSKTKSNTDNLFLPSRLESGLLLSKMLLSDFRILKRFKEKTLSSNISVDDIILFTSSIFISSGEKRNIYTFSKLNNLLNREIQDYSDIDYIKHSNEFRRLNNQFQNIKKTISRIKRHKIPRKIKLPDKLLDDIINNNRLAINRILELYGSYIYCLYSFKNLEKSIIELILPLISVKDYMYVCRKFQKDYKSPELLKKYILLLTEYTIAINDSIEKFFFSDSFSYSNLKEIKEILCLWQFYKQYFIVFIDLPISNDELNLKINITAPSQRSKHRCFDYPVSLKIANSVHLEISSSDVGYKIAKRNKKISFWGRKITSSSLLHLNTRKKSIFPPYIKESNNFIDNILLDDSIKSVTVKYRLSNFLRLSMIFFTFLMLYALFFAHSDNLIFLSCVVPLVSIFITVFAIGKWSLTHFLMKKYNFILLFLSFLLLSNFILENQFDISILNVDNYNTVIDVLKIFSEKCFFTIKEWLKNCFFKTVVVG